ncbi:response regulator transcription factor [Pedobacter ureilyticus]|uniref:Response regulator transcription factor n=1 Tax=Pedobacter ureilyticus TaxID=1393051 RepID=A0ABW9J813_9SPHI|nr:response regulator [Pedobacter helvus]
MKKEITILEDDQDIREICTYLFSAEGYSVNSYGTISSFKRSTANPDIYLLDIRLPDGNGMDVCKSIKDNPILAKIPIIMMSAHLDASTVSSQCSAEEFIYKPFHITDLLDRAAALINRYRAG